MIDACAVPLSRRRSWTEEDRAVLRALYPVRSTANVASVLRRSVKSVYANAAILGLRKSAEFLASEESGRLRKGQMRPGSVASQFQPGCVPANKGLRRPGWSPGRMRETQFQKGSRSGVAAQAWKPIGTISSDSGGYLRIKVRDAVYGKEPSGFGNVRVWPLLQRHVWEQHHGPIPPGNVIAFLDGDRTRCVIENLECISRAELARRNTMWGRFPQELAEAIQLNGALKQKLRNLHGQE